VIALALQGVLLGLSSAAAPGPFQAVLVARSLRLGPARALPLSLVPATSDPVVIAVVLSVLNRLPSTFLRSLTAAGALVVLGIGAATLRTASRGSVPRALESERGRSPESLGPSEGRLGSFLAAAVVNVTNPNAWIFWSAVGGPLVASAWRAAPGGAIAFLASFYGCISAGNAALAVAAGSMARAGPRAARGLGLASGTALLVFGGWQLVRVLSG